MEEATALEIPEQSKAIGMLRTPKAVLEEAKGAAIALQAIIENKKKPVIFNGEQYLEFEDWQTIAKFYGLAVRTHDAQPVEINKVQGAKALAEVIDVRSGLTIGSAEAYCLRDEPNWARKPWFQLASMAQTRAGSKSLRNLLSWVAVLAGYKPTPAEEMTQDAIAPVAPPPATPAIDEQNQTGENRHTSSFEVSEPIPSKKPGKFYRKAMDSEGASFYVFDNTVISDLQVAAGKQVTVKIDSSTKWPRIVSVEGYAQ